MPSPPVGFRYEDDDDAAPRRAAYDYTHDHDHDNDRRSSYRVTPPNDEPYHRGSRSRADDDDKEEYRRHYSRGSKTHDGDRERDSARDLLSGAASFLPAKYSQKVDKRMSRDSDSDKDRKKKEKKERLEDDLAYGSGSLYPRADSPPSSRYSYSKTERREYERPDDKASHTVRHAEQPSRPLSPPRGGRDSGRAPSPGPERTHSAERRSPRDSFSGSARLSGPNVLTVEPGASNRRSRSPQPPVKRMSSLSVNTGLPAGSSLSVANAPGSPLLESYHGTYQSMSPMPSPLLLASKGPLSPIEPLSPSFSDDERGDKKKRRARFHDPVDDAARLAKALKGENRAPETEPLIEILPGMTHEQIMDLRTEYKRIVKTGSERKGVNVAKHIRARLKDEDPLLMKACYATALGQWESEAYWANFWYHGDKTRRELLIESIMGRTNDEIRRIKDGFNDKKYRDSLTQCMKTELKEDKFKKAVLLVLDERRMEELDGYGRLLPVDRRLVEDDVKDLHRAVKSERGGETAMIQIVVVRSDPHLRDVLKLYERNYRSNFAHDALKKSGNLVVSGTLFCLAGHARANYYAVG